MTDFRALFRPHGGFFLIAGPCVLEDESTNLAVAEEVARVGERLGVPVLFKASFDKANRSSVASPRGPGLEEGLRRLAKIKSSVGLPVTTDVHLPEQAAPVAEVVDVVQIPAFLCRQTDLVIAAAAAGRPLNLKKGQWMAPEDMANQVEKARHAGAEAIAVTERGTAFGYHNLVVDMRSFALMKEACNCPAAAEAGADAIFVEVHPDPASALSDAASMLRLDELEGLVARVLAVREALGAGEGSADV